MESVLKRYATISRWEFLPATAVAILIGVFLGTNNWTYLFVPMHILVILEGLVVFFLLFNVGFMINCWADWKVDEIYKKKLAASVKGFGRDTVRNLVIVHVALALVITIHISLIMTWKPVLFFLVLLGTFLGVAYSIEPFRFKSKGVFHSVMAFPVFSAPGLFSYYLVNDMPFSDLYSQVFLVLVIGITVAHYGLVLLSQSEDYPDDKKMKIRTPAVAWGIRRTVNRAFKLNMWGTSASVTAFVLLFYLASPARPYLLALLPLLMAMTYFTTYKVYKLDKAVSEAPSDKEALKVLRKVMKDYPMFHAIPLGAIMLCSLVLMVARSLGWP
jgi:4-hydroxybenzoate polyprenyltransferase